MNCTLHPDMVVNSSCDICHQPFCPICLINDRGRFVCKQCFDPENQPAELASTSADLSDEERLARIESKKAFWQSPTGAGIRLAIRRLLTCMCATGIYLSILTHNYGSLFKSALWIVVIYGLRFFKIPKNQLTGVWGE